MSYGGCNRAGSVLADVLSDQAMQEKLDDQCASDEYVAICEQIEMQAFEVEDGKLDSTSQQPLDDALRHLAIGFLGRLISGLHLPETSWSSAVLLLDAYIRRSTSRVEARNIPLLCGVLVRLMQKTDDAVSSPSQSALFAVMASVGKFEEYLRRAGHDMPVQMMTEEAFWAQEFTVLKRLRWQLRLPTVDSWMSCYCARINTLTRQAIVYMLVPVWQQSLQLGQRLFLHRAACPIFRPQRVARGLLSLACVAVEMLPPDIFGADAHELRGVFTLPPPQGDAAANGELRQQFFAELLQLATCSKLPSLRKDCDLVRNVLRENDIAPKCAQV